MKENRFVGIQENYNVSQCIYCKHKLNNDACKAFPEKIPDAILLNKVSHLKPYPGDHGVRFEVKEGG